MNIDEHAEICRRGEEIFNSLDPKLYEGYHSVIVDVEERKMVSKGKTTLETHENLVKVEGHRYYVRDINPVPLDLRGII